MLGLSRKQIIHALMALGTGSAVFLYQATSITHNAWLVAGCYGGLAMLGALGVGAANRAGANEAPSSSSSSSPEPASSEPTPRPYGQ